MSSYVLPISIPFNQASLAPGLLIAMPSVSLSLVSLFFGNSSHCCQGIFLKEESDSFISLVKPLWDLLAHSIESKPLSKGHEVCLTWPGLLLTSLSSHVLLCSPYPKSHRWVLKYSRPSHVFSFLLLLKCSPLPCCLAIAFQPPQPTEMLTTCQCFQAGVIANPLFLRLWL